MSNICLTPTCAIITVRKKHLLVLIDFRIKLSVFSAGRPEPPGNCSIVNQTADLLQAECDSGHDGGLPQLFVMELFDALDHSLISNVTSRSPSFLVTDLPPGLEMDVVLYAANAKGRSRSSLLHAFTLRSAARRSGIPRYTLVFSLLCVSS